jgi:hypothetical protein
MRTTPTTAIDMDDEQRADGAGGRDFVAALQLADSALPIGRFVHSHGLEAWLGREPAPSEDEIAELVESVVGEAVGPLDGVVLVHAHRAGTLSDLLDLDRALTARKMSSPARAASRACGRQLANLSGTLVDDVLVARLAAEVRERRTDGNLAVGGAAVIRRPPRAPRARPRAGHARRHGPRDRARSHTRARRRARRPAVFGYRAGDRGDEPPTGTRAALLDVTEHAAVAGRARVDGPRLPAWAQGSAVPCGSDPLLDLAAVGQRVLRVPAVRADA